MGDLVALQGHVPPHDLDCQAAIIAASILDDDARAEALMRLRTEHFYGDHHALTWAAISELEASGKPVDVIAVASWLRDRQQIQRVGGTAALGEMLDMTPSVTLPTVRAYADKVIDLWRMRQVVALCRRTVAEAHGDVGDRAAWLDTVESSLHGIIHQAKTADAVTIGEALKHVFAEMSAAAERGAAITGYSTGLVDLDKRTSGLHPGEVTVLAARPGMGKSAAAFGIAHHIAAGAFDGHGECLTPPRGVYVVSLEMPTKQVATRVLCADARVDVRRVRAAELTAADWEAMANHARPIAQVPMVIDDNGSITIMQLRAKLRRQVTEWARDGIEPGLVVVDYLQLMSEPSKDRNREQEIAYISRNLKVLAKEFKVHVLALAQLNRSVEARSDKRPMLSDLRESGAIEQDADCVIFIYRDDYYNQDSEDRGIAELIIAKQRNGGTGTVRVRWVAHCTRFETLAEVDAADFEPEPVFGGYA